ncbi:MAG: hypothetical protein JXM70_10785 [Pirellulales bacterium]|nr:hypothetical protein [Pirellulales bacterium]
MRISTASLLFYFFIISLGWGAEGKVSLEDGFRNPPREYSIVPLWSWNGRLEPAELRRQIDEMVDKGVYGAFMHARAGINLDETPYFSEGWWKAVEVSVEHAANVGFDTWLYDEDKWPSGAAGGRTIARNPQRNRRKGLDWKQHRVDGPARIEVNFPDAAWVFAFKLNEKKQIDPETLIEITEFNCDKKSGKTVQSKKAWTCPEGEWVLLTFSHQTDEGVNYLNRQTVRDFIDITHEEYARRFGKYFGTTIPGVFFDEILNSHVRIVWTEGFEEKFKQLKGYDLRPLLPALIIDIGPRTPKIRCDYYDVYTTFYEEAWFKQLADWCDEHKLQLTGHTIEELGGYRSQGSYFRTIRHMQIPATDNESFRWRYPREVIPFKPKQLASISHLYGRPRAGVEAMGGAGWSFTLDTARYGHNLLAAHGINFFMTHLFHYAQDRPENVDDWPNSWFFRNPYWKYFKTFADHSSRLSYMLTGGQHVVDVAMLYPQENLWAGNGQGATQSSLEKLVAAQIDVDFIDPESLLRAKVADGRINVSQMHYRLLVVPGVKCVRRSVAEKIAAFAKAGGVVLVLDRYPADSMDVGRDDPEISRFVKDWQKHGAKLIPAEVVTEEIAKQIPRDVIFEGKGSCPLRYQHVRRAGHEIYWLANNSKEKGTWRVSFRAAGQPSIWQPEDGSIRPLGMFVRKDARTQCEIALDTRQGCFVVFDTAKVPEEGGIIIESTNLRQLELTKEANGRFTASGMLPAGQDQVNLVAEVVEGQRRKSIKESMAVPPSPKAINLDGPWRFLAVGDQLDKNWRVDVTSSELAMPVMRIRWELPGVEVANWHLSNCDDSHWRRIKVFDKFYSTKGADRYRSRWQGHFITHYEYYAPNTGIGGKGLRCRKTLALPEGTSGWLAVVCPSKYKLSIDDQNFAGIGGKQAQRFDIAPLSGNKHTINIHAENAPALLLEGRLRTPNGRTVLVRTNATWEAQVAGRDWRPAWEYVAPPEKPFGEPAYPIEMPRPRVVWYRQPLPPGTVTVLKPEIEGRWKAWLDGKPLEFAKGTCDVSIASHQGMLAIRVELDKDDHGLIKPIRVRCRPVEQPLGSWTNRHLGWYTGRAVYSTTFQLGADYKQDDVRLELDLGKVCWCAEVWLNGQLLGTRIWPPYKLDITQKAKQGENRIDIVVSNLLANRMHWNIFDDAKAEIWNRNWHDGNILRDRWCLESGLIGPVCIQPLREVSISLREK